MAVEMGDALAFAQQGAQPPARFVTWTLAAGYGLDPRVEPKPAAGVSKDTQRAFVFDPRRVLGRNRGEVGDELRHLVSPCVNGRAQSVDHGASHQLVSHFSLRPRRSQTMS